MKRLIFILTFLFSLKANTQTLYFPPTTGNVWDTISPSTLGWCPEKIDSLYAYLDDKHTDGFLLLKDGKIVLEKYFGTFTADSFHYWASAGKSLTATLVGIAQQQGLVNINNSVNTYLGAGWTSAPANKESAITVKHLLTMTSGLDDNPPSPCDNEDTAASCLLYLADAGTRWAYHTGAYRKLQAVVSSASGMSYTAFTNSKLANQIGLTGAWINGVYYSRLRGMARFGLLMLNKGKWNATTILSDTAYYRDMLHSSQPYNLSYGYLWWLNGQASAMAPGSQIVFNQQLFNDAPADLVAALGKNDQKIYVVPSQNMVVVRMGDSAYGSVLAFSDFDNELWQHIADLTCTLTGIGNINPDALSVFPNPSHNSFTIKLDEAPFSYQVFNHTGALVMNGVANTNTVQLNTNNLPKGLYIVKAESAANNRMARLVIE